MRQSGSFSLGFTSSKRPVGKALNMPTVSSAEGLDPKRGRLYCRGFNILLSIKVYRRVKFH